MAKPDVRSSVDSKPPDLQAKVAPNPCLSWECEINGDDQEGEPYPEGREVYHTGRLNTGADPNPFTVHKCLGKGRYKLERNGEVMTKIYYAEELHAAPNDVSERKAD